VNLIKKIKLQNKLYNLSHAYAPISIFAHVPGIIIIVHKTIWKGLIQYSELKLLTNLREMTNPISKTQDCQWI